MKLLITLRRHYDAVSELPLRKRERPQKHFVIKRLFRNRPDVEQWFETDLPIELLKEAICHWHRAVIYERIFFGKNAAYVITWRK